VSDDVDIEALRMHLVQAYTRAVHPDAIAHIHAALRELDADVPPGLVECPVCARVMLPERLDAHDCDIERTDPNAYRDESANDDLNATDISENLSCSGTTLE